MSNGSKTVLLLMPNQYIFSKIETCFLQNIFSDLLKKLNTKQRSTNPNICKYSPGRHTLQLVGHIQPCSYTVHIHCQLGLGDKTNLDRDLIKMYVDKLWTVFLDMDRSNSHGRNKCKNSQSVFCLSASVYCVTVPQWTVAQSRAHSGDNKGKSEAPK